MQIYIIHTHSIFVESNIDKTERVFVLDAINLRHIRCLTLDTIELQSGALDHFLSLQSLEINNCRLDNILRLTNTSWLTKLARLRSLSLKSISGLNLEADLSNSNLTQFICSDCNEGRFIFPESLQRLVIPKDCLDLDTFAKLTNLTDLHLAAGTDKSVVPIPLAPNLTRLQVHTPTILPKIKIFSLLECSFFAESTGDLGNPNLNSLTKLVDNCSNGLTQVYNFHTSLLELVNTRMLLGQDPRILVQYSRLESIHLASWVRSYPTSVTRLTTASLMTFNMGLINLRILKITDGMPLVNLGELSCLTNLESLSLGLLCNGNSPNSVKIPQLPNLTKLGIRKRVYPADLIYIDHSDATRLQKLTLGPEIYPPWAIGTRLSELALDYPGDQLTVDWLSDCVNLTKLKFTGLIQENVSLLGLSKLTKLERLILPGDSSMVGTLQSRISERLIPITYLRSKYCDQ